MGALQYGDVAGRTVSQRIAAPVADIPTLKGFSAGQVANGMMAHVISDGSLWRFNVNSVLTGNDLLVATPTAGTGRWLRVPSVARLVLPITFATADATALLTLQAGQVLRVRGLYWIITTNFTGGTASSIGVGSSKTGFTAKGSLLGGAAGELAAALVTGNSPTMGTVGSRAAEGASRLIRETVAVAAAAATPTYTIDQLLYAKTTGTGAPAIKAALINGATPGAGQAAPILAGTSIAFNAETTGTGTVDVWYLTAQPQSLSSAIFLAGDTIRFDQITSAFTAGAGSVNLICDVLQNDGQ